MTYNRVITVLNREGKLAVTEYPPKYSGYNKAKKAVLQTCILSLGYSLQDMDHTRIFVSVVDGIKHSIPPVLAPITPKLSTNELDKVALLADIMIHAETHEVI